jgi:hypothetical protein
MANETLEHLADRLRQILDGDPRITEKRMFGGLSFLLNGHLFVSAKKDGRVLASVGKATEAEALQRPGAQPMQHGGRRMPGFLWIDADAIEDDDALRDWVALCEKYVATLPPK